MNNIKVSSNGIDDKMTKLNKYIDILEKDTEKVESILKVLSYKNNTYYSSTTINLYNHFIENSSSIRQLHKSYRDFINSLNIINETYQGVEDNLLKQVENISSIHINE